MTDHVDREEDDDEPVEFDDEAADDESTNEDRGGYSTDKVIADSDSGPKALLIRSPSRRGDQTKDEDEKFGNRERSTGDRSRFPHSASRSAPASQASYDTTTREPFVGESAPSDPEPLEVNGTHVPQHVSANYDPTAPVPLSPLRAAPSRAVRPRSRTGRRRNISQETLDVVYSSSSDVGPASGHTPPSRWTRLGERKVSEGRLHGSSVLNTSSISASRLNHLSIRPRTK